MLCRQLRKFSRNWLKFSLRFVAAFQKAATRRNDQVLQTTIRRLHDAWDAFRERGFGFPRFKKFGQFKSLLFPQFKTNPLTGWQIKLPKLKGVRINLHRPIPEGFTIKQVRVIKKAIGWFAVITIESDIFIPEVKPYGHPIGIDLGITKFLATSDGFLEKGQKFFTTERLRLEPAF